jgi:GNAT superfamily N-acetyltransferase
MEYHTVYVSYDDFDATTAEYIEFARSGIGYVGYQYYAKIPKTIVVYCIDPSISTQPIALGTACIYARGTTERNEQWEFGANRNRQAWIDLMWVTDSHRNQGLGTIILCRLEEQLRAVTDDVDRRNIYVKSATGSEYFYVRRGYTLIDTEEYPDDEVAHGACSGHWLAKNIDHGEPVHEKEYIPDIFDALEMNHRPLIQSLFTEEIDIDKLYSLRDTTDDDFTDEIIEQRKEDYRPFIMRAKRDIDRDQLNDMIAGFRPRTAVVDTS